MDWKSAGECPIKFSEIDTYLALSVVGSLYVAGEGLVEFSIISVNIVYGSKIDCNRRRVWLLVTTDFGDL